MGVKVPADRFNFFGTTALSKLHTRLHVNTHAHVVRATVYGTVSEIQPCYIAGVAMAAEQNTWVLHDIEMMPERPTAAHPDAAAEEQAAHPDYDEAAEEPGAAATANQSAFTFDAGLIRVLMTWVMAALCTVWAKARAGGRRVGAWVKANLILIVPAILVPAIIVLAFYLRGQCPQVTQHSPNPDPGPDPDPDPNPNPVYITLTLPLAL